MLLQSCINQLKLLPAKERACVRFFLPVFLYLEKSMKVGVWSIFPAMRMRSIQMKNCLLIVMIVLGFASVSMAGDFPSPYTDWAIADPAAATTSDSIDIIVGGFSNNAIFINDTPWTIENNVIEITLEIDSMVLPVLTDWTKTIELGTFEVGVYQVNVFEVITGIGCNPLTGCDNPAASTSFTVVPEPGSIGVLVCGAMVMMRRRG